MRNGRPGAGLVTRLAQGADDLRAAQRLRYQVFVQELGADGAHVDHANRLECDPEDAAFDHLLLVDQSKDPATLAHVVGVYRLLTDDRAAALGRFYGDSEYDLGPLRRSGRRLVELSRSCVHPDHRRGAAMLFLWQGLADYVLARGVEIMFGVASFHGTDPGRHAQALSLLHHFHLAPAGLRPRALPEHFQPMNLIAPDEIDQAAALAAMPSLIRAYLRLGGFVGEGAFVDHPFNTTDVCLVMDTAAMSARHVGFYTRKAQRGGAHD
ncbi:MAG: l-ornithine N(alpha)-acyltransferase [Pararhodobacter sp.]